MWRKSLFKIICVTRLYSKSAAWYRSSSRSATWGQIVFKIELYDVRLSPRFGMQHQTVFMISQMKPDCLQNQLCHQIIFIISCMIPDRLRDQAREAKLSSKSTIWRQTFAKICHVTPDATLYDARLSLTSAMSHRLSSKYAIIRFVFNSWQLPSWPTNSQQCGTLGNYALEFWGWVTGSSRSNSEIYLLRIVGSVWSTRYA